MQVLLEEDNSTYGYPIPEEMQEIFIQMPESKHWFDKIAPGKQRYILMFVDSVKSPLLRADKAVLVAQNLISCKNPKISYEDLIKK